MYGEFTIVEAGGRSRPTRRVYLGEVGGRNEGWLRDLLILHPEILPVRDIDPTFGPLQPLCTELRTEAGPIDAAFINQHGRLTIAECKLWKNPQARREVVGQILDYVSALSRWSYADLQRQTSMASGEHGNVPYDRVKAASGGVREADFIDAVGASLREGRILALIVGDGIRDEVQRLAETINRNVSKAFTFGLVEVALYEAADGGQLLVQPRVLARTETVPRYLTTVVGPGGQVIDVREEVPAANADAERPAGKQHLKEWWKPVLNMTFDDPEQDAPFWVGTNNVVLNTPFPGVQIKAYAMVGQPRMAVYVHVKSGPTPSTIGRLLGRTSNAISGFLARESAQIEDALPPGTEVRPWENWSIVTPEAEITDDDERRAWIIATLNTYVNVLRPRLRRWYEEATKG